MIKIKDRVYIALGTYFLATIGLFFTGIVWWYLLIIPAVLYIVLGGKKHV